MSKRDFEKPVRKLWSSTIDKSGNIKMNYSGMKTIKTFESFVNDEVNETYYNKDWNITNIENWILEYANKNGLDTKENGSKKFGKDKSAKSWLLGKYNVLIVTEKAPGAPRLGELTVAIGDHGANDFALKDAKSITSHVGDKDQMFKMFDAKIKG